MNDDENPHRDANSAPASAAVKKASSRQERKAAALRANLRRRKAQARGRKADTRPDDGDASGGGTS